MKTDPEGWKTKDCATWWADDSDPKKPIELVEQLVGALDARQARLEGPHRRPQIRPAYANGQRYRLRLRFGNFQKQN
jgi:hypothetical protein